MKIQVKSYFKEAKWFYDNYTPTMDEYLSEALNTSYFTLATTSLVGMGSVVTKDSLDWVFSDPHIVKAASLIGRLVDDMKSHKIGEGPKELGSFALLLQLLCWSFIYQ